MVEKQQTKEPPTEDDKSRIAEAILNLDRFEKIKDNDSFDDAYDDYFEDNDYWLKTKYLRKDIMGRVFKQRTFEEAGGKDLKQDKLKTAKKVVGTKEEFIKKGAQRVDLSGLDTFRGRKIKVKRLKRDFRLVGKIRGKIVKIRKTSVIVRNKRQLRYRDKIGRFASIRRK